MIFCNGNKFLRTICSTRPTAYANIAGGNKYPDITGKVKFYGTKDGTLVYAQIINLPKTKTNFFGMHIHSGKNCEGDFSSAGPHLDGENMHPLHTGDMPLLINANNIALSIFLDNRFLPKDIVGKTIIIHLEPDDFVSQPAGNSGERIACGEIKSSN